MKLLRILSLLFLVSFGATVFLTQLTIQPQTLPTGRQVSPVRVEIASGEGLKDIAATLKRHGAIRSATAFRLYLKSRGIDRSIQSGTFLIEPGMSFAEIAETLGEGREMIVTIPEGYTVAQIDALLAGKKLIESGELVACASSLPREAPEGSEVGPAPRSSALLSKVGCDFSTFGFLPEGGSALEGYLFPDTYSIAVPEFAPALFLERLLSTFEQRVVTGLADDLDRSGRSLSDIVTMASLIERETRTDTERPVVSGILWKRLDAGRGLDVDATIRYALRKPSGALTKADLESGSPYNTRRLAGLPPGPIANPGLASIEAALHPEESPYWYYLHGRDGQIRYSETNDEHNEKKARYL